MGVLHVILILIEAVTCLLLMGVILLQKSKGEGLGTAFGGGGMGETLFGSRTGNVLTKITVTLAIVFLANTILIGVLFTHRTERSIMDRAAGPIATAPLAPPTATPDSAPAAAPAQAPASAALLQDSGAQAAPDAE